jgi:MFS family permease
MFRNNALFRNKIFLAVSLSYCASTIGLGMIVPIRVLYAQSHGASVAIIAAMSSGYMISNFLFQYPSGWLADHWSRKPLIILSILGQAALSAVYLFIADPIWFVALRIVEGMVAAAYLPSARALITDAIPVTNRGEAFGLFSAFMNVGWLLGPAIGGLTAGMGDAIPFYGAILFRLVALVLVVLLIHPPARTEAEHQAQATPVKLRELFSWPLVAAYIMTFGDWLFVGFDTTLFPLWLNRLGASVTWIGVVYMFFSLPGIFLALWTGKLADRRKRSSLLLLFGLAQVPIYIAYGLANSYWLVVPLFLLHGTFWIFVQPAVDAHLANASHEQARAQIQGLYSGIGLLGGFVGASCFGPLYEWNFRSPLFVMGIAYGLCMLIGGLLVHTFEKKFPARGLITDEYSAAEANASHTVK